MLRLELPYPPSANHYYRHIGHVTLISRRGRAYRAAVVAMLQALGIRPLSGPLDVRLELYPPDRRRRDCDNAQKPVLDALQHGGAYHDDSQIVHLETWKLAPLKGGKAIVCIEEVVDVASLRPEQREIIPIGRERRRRAGSDLGSELPRRQGRRVRGAGPAPGLAG
jgi:Holliday junction resolvase RusA-like endonuclease